MNDHDPVSVHVENFADMTFKTEEREPEHFSFTTITLLPGQLSQPVLALDPLRKDASILPIDAPIVLCDSAAQAMSAGNQVSGFTAPDGAYLPQGTPASLNGTGPCWAACQVATRVSVIVNRRSA